MTMHMYMPWWKYREQLAGKLDFPRGYHIEYWGGMGMPAYGFGWGIEKVNGMFPDRNGKPHEAGGYGAALKDDYRRFYGAYIGMAGRGEAVAREDNYCEIDPEKVDKYGIPVLRFHYKWSDHERLQAKQEFGCMLLQANNWADWPATLRSYELFARYVMPLSYQPCCVKRHQVISIRKPSQRASCVCSEAIMWRLASGC